MTVRARHLENLRKCAFHQDPAQDRAITALDALLDRLGQGPGKRWWQRLARRNDAQIVGLYLWGGVGRGKTYLMDLFFECLETTRKKRQHFHRFMNDIHGRLKKLTGVRNPLRSVAAELAEDSDIICFDEFFVSDIADAMILAGLFDELFRLGVVLVATSNVAPDDLYKDGLQRARFLPAIDLIKLNTEVLHIGGETDYRFQILKRAEIYHSPLDDDADSNLARYFEQFAPECGGADQDLEILGRPIRTRRRADGVVWFEFAEICDGPRGTNDYIEVARCFHTVLISGVPQLTPSQDDQARRFISLVDEFYDRKVKLILSAAVADEELYAGKRLAFEFTRTTSRLREMQSDGYLAMPHVP